MRYSRQWLMIGLGLGGLGGVGLVGMAGCDRGSSAPQAAAPQVTVATVQPQTVSLATQLPGRTSAFLVAEIRPQVNGLIQKRLFVEGADVQAGQVLYQIDPAPFQAAYESAQANLDAAKKNADRAMAALDASLANVARQQATLTLAQTNRQRFEELFQEKAVSASDRDQAVTEADVAQATLQAMQAQVQSDRAGIAGAQAGIQQAQAAIQTAKINLDYTCITAPISGRIGRSSVTDGAIVTAYQATALATIQQLDPMYVDIPQSTTQVMRMQRRLADGRLHDDGDNQNKVTLLFEDDRPYPLAGRLQFRDVSVDATTGSVIVRAVFPNPQGVLMPNMFVRAMVTEGASDQAILIPQQSVSRDPKGNPQVMVVDGENKVELRNIQIERAMGSNWMVTCGLKVGDRIVVDGLQRVRPGVTVQASAYQPSAGTSQAK